MKQRNAFTLIELLVVIAIIALLMGIIMPSLGLAKEKARAVVCKSNLKQWGVMFALYTQENDDTFMEPFNGLWVDPLRPYYGSGSSEDIRLCPSTSIEKADPFLKAWTTAATGGITETDYASSYGINNWIYDPGSAATLWTKPTKHNWKKTTNVTASHTVPLFLECYRWGGSPDTGDIPSVKRPETDAELAAAASGSEMNRFNLDRHRVTCNVLFVDGSVEVVDLRGLWGLKWHKEYSGAKEMSRLESSWPGWMEK